MTLPTIAKFAFIAVFTHPSCGFYSFWDDIHQKRILWNLHWNNDNVSWYCRNALCDCAS